MFIQSPGAKPETPINGEDLTGPSCLSSGHQRIVPRPSAVHNSSECSRAGKPTPQKARSVNQGNPASPLPRLTSGTAQTTFVCCTLVPLPESEAFSKPIGKKSGSRRLGSFLTFFRSSFPKIPVTGPIFDPATLPNLIFLLSGGNSDSFYCIYLSQIYCTQMDISGLCFLLRGIFILSHQ